MRGNFNPRTHRGVRRLYFDDNITLLFISIHAPIVGCDVAITENNQYIIRFQSTHPSWGATLIGRTTRDIDLNFNPRTHRGVRRVNCFPKHNNSLISIHAPIVGCDIEAETTMGRWTEKISIHAPIVGCDYIVVEKLGSYVENISIHAPIVGCDM